MCFKKNDNKSEHVKSLHRLRSVLNQQIIKTPQKQRHSMVKGRYDIVDRKAAMLSKFGELTRKDEDKKIELGQPKSDNEDGEEEKENPEHKKSILKNASRSPKRRKTRNRLTRSLSFLKQSIVGNKSKGKKQKKTILDIIFFIHFSRLFDVGSKRTLLEGDLFPLPPAVKCSNLVKQYDNLELAHGTQLGRNLFRLVQTPMAYAVCLKIVEQGLGVIMPFLMASFLNQIKKEKEDREYRRIYAIICSAVMITMLKSLFKEHSMKYTCQVMSRTGQCLRGIFYSHIMTANYSFLKTVDTSFIAKMSIYEFDAIIKFMGNIPNFASFPFTFILSVSLIVNQVGSSSLVMLIVFLLASMFLAYLDHKMLFLNEKYKKIGSKRTLLLTEMLSDMREVKINSWEHYFGERLEKVRNREISVLNKLSLDRALSNCLFFLTPIICSALIIFIKHNSTNETLDIGVAFAIVSVLNQLQKPLNILSSSVDLYIDFKIGHTSLSRFFRYIPQKPDSFKNITELDIGEIRLSYCTGCLEDDIETHEQINKIFGIRDKRLSSKHLSKKNEQNDKNSTNSKKKSEKSNNSKMKSIPSTALEEVKEVDEKVEVVKSKKTHLMPPSPKKQQRGSINLRPRASMKMIPNDEFQGRKNKISKRPVGRRSKKRKTTGDSSITNLLQIIKSTRNLIKKGEDQTLKMIHMDVSLMIKPGQKVCFIGRHNSGCSEVLLTIRGETKITQGFADVHGFVAYLDLKQPFFVNSFSLKENITLSKQGFDNARYKEVLKCSEIDTKKFKGGDQTEVIENGKNFSSGERRKIMLARFLYQENDIYLFDHYFDELESKKHMNHFFRVVKTYLKEKTVVYVSRKQEFVKEADQIFVFDNGSVVDSGTFDELMNSDKRYFRDLLIKDGNEVDKKMASKMRKMVNSAMLTKLSCMATNNLSSSAQVGLYKFLANHREDKVKKLDKSVLAELFKAIATVQIKRELGKVTSEKEEMVTQSLPYLTTTYLFILGKCRIFFLLLIFFITVMGFLSADVWLGLWSSKTLPSLSFINYFNIYALICILTSIFVILRDIAYHIILRKNSDSLHFKMLTKFFNTNMLWFIKNPSSRVTFRLTRDQRVIDETLNDILQQTFDALIMVVGGLLILNIIYYGVMAVITIIMMVLTFRILKKFFKVTHSIAQYQAAKKADLQAMYFRAMNDATHFRSLSMLQLLQERFFDASDEFQRMTTHLSFFSQRWLGIRLMYLQGLMILVAYALPFLIKEYASELFFKQQWQFALAITWSGKIIDHSTNLIHSFSKTVHQTISVGRMLNYLKHDYIEEENDKEVEPIEFENQFEYPIQLEGVSLKLGKRMVLDNINLRVRKRARLAIFGASGSGKHSLMNVIAGIFQRNSGDLKVFGKNIDNVHKQEVRELSFYVSATPMLFAGTVRDNIDPDYRFEDMDLIKVLAYLGFYDLIKINTASLEDIKEWEVIQNNPQYRINLMVNLADFITRTEHLKSMLQSEDEGANQSRRAIERESLVNRLYEGLVGDMLMGGKAKFQEKYRGTILEQFAILNDGEPNALQDQQASRKRIVSFHDHSKIKNKGGEKNGEKDKKKQERHSSVARLAGVKKEKDDKLSSDRSGGGLSRSSGEKSSIKLSRLSEGDSKFSQKDKKKNSKESNTQSKNPSKMQNKTNNTNSKAFVSSKTSHFGKNIRVMKSVQHQQISVSSDHIISERIIQNKLGSPLTPNPHVKMNGDQKLRIHDVSNLMKLSDFSLESLSSGSPENEEYKTISNFLNMKVLSKGGNIPWNMRKLIILAKAFIEEPYLLFMDETSIDLGYANSWRKYIRKIKSNFKNSMIVTFLKSLKNVNEFEEIILMEDGKIKEQGDVEDLILDPNSLISKKMKIEDEKLYKSLKTAIQEKDNDLNLIVKHSEKFSMISSCDNGLSEIGAFSPFKTNLRSKANYNTNNQIKKSQFNTQGTMKNRPSLKVNSNPYATIKKFKTRSLDGMSPTNRKQNEFLVIEEEPMSLNNSSLYKTKRNKSNQKINLDEKKGLEAELGNEDGFSSLESHSRRMDELGEESGNLENLTDSDFEDERGAFYQVSNINNMSRMQMKGGDRSHRLVPKLSESFLNIKKTQKLGFPSTRNKPEWGSKRPQSKHLSDSFVPEVRTESNVPFSRKSNLGKNSSSKFNQSASNQANKELSRVSKEPIAVGKTRFMVKEEKGSLEESNSPASESSSELGRSEDLKRGDKRMKKERKKERKKDVENKSKKMKMMIKRKQTVVSKNKKNGFKKMQTKKDGETLTCIVQEEDPGRRNSRQLKISALNQIVRGYNFPGEINKEMKEMESKKGGKGEENPKPSQGDPQEAYNYINDDSARVPLRSDRNRESFSSGVSESSNASRI